LSHPETAECPICAALKRFKLAAGAHPYVHRILEHQLSTGDVFDHAKSAGIAMPTDSEVCAMVDAVYDEIEGDEEDEPEAPAEKRTLQ
jgi:hypothetical protein